MTGMSWREGTSDYGTTHEMTFSLYILRVWFTMAVYP